MGWPNLPDRLPPVWLEVALNGPWSRAQQPLIPLTVAEIIAEGIGCARAGAAIVHVHARDPDTGAQRDDADLYAAIIEGIRTEVDAIVYPTLPLAGAAGHEAGDSIATRFAAVEELARRGLLEWMVLDPGSVNFLHATDIAAGTDGFVYRNPGEHIRAGLELAARVGAHPSYAIYEAGFLRAGAAMARAIPGVPRPIHRFMFSTGFRFGFPPRPYGLQAWLQLLAEEEPDAPWMIAGLDVDVLPIAAEAVARGGHLRVGLEDAPFGSTLDNLAWVQRSVDALAAAHARPATPEEVRASLARP